MKNWTTIRSAFVLSVGLLVSFSTNASAAAATGFEISWWTVDGGAGVSTGGGFGVTGTIGQPDAAPRLTDGCWSVDPGFWGAYAVVATPGAPTLRIRLRNLNTIRVSFNPGCDDWVLQYATELGVSPAPTLWTDDTVTILIADGDELARDFHMPGWGPRLFFRLRKP